MNLVHNIRVILLEDLALQIQQLKDKYVGQGKPMKEQDFAKIQEVANNKFNYIAWLSKRVGTNLIKAEDIYKYKEYFELFEKNKNKFTHKDINLYKTSEDIQKFLEEVILIREGGIVFDETKDKDNFVSQKDIEKLVNSGGVKYLGLYDNGDLKYQVFQIFSPKKDVWKIYRDILGRCKGRDRGAKIDICTIGQFSYFKDYLTNPKGSSYFLLYNLEDPKSPYQLHYESGQFMDKNDNERHKIKQLKFFDFVGKLVPYYSLSQEDFPGDFEVPVPGKGGLDEKNRKQGLWRTFEYGKLSSVNSYLNGRTHGPFISYFEDSGKISTKGTIIRGDFVGEFEEYYESGKPSRKGTFGEEQSFIGLWQFYDRDGSRKEVDYDTTPPSLSAFTKSGDLRLVSFVNRPNITPYGETIYFYKSGAVNAMGKMGVKFRIGEWTYFNPDGTTLAKGKYHRDRPSGEWFYVLKTKKGEKIILVCKWEGDHGPENVKIYNINGEFLDKVKFSKIKPVGWWRFHLSDYSFTRNI